ncbi:hypothetical protein niasHT_030601 [Heterodera trifolii]|uniref:Uncharacterized protein n=1 Tax=Heterodera trifolii TaxID=157864 RepID=A0ABD2ITY4_9BILA
MSSIAIIIFFPLFVLYATDSIASAAATMADHLPQRRADAELAVEEDTAQKDNLFSAYLSRGMFSCAGKYVGTLQRLKRIIEEVHADYSECQKSMKQMDEDEQMAFGKGHGTERFAMIDELIN